MPTSYNERSEIEVRRILIQNSELQYLQCRQIRQFEILGIVAEAKLPDRNRFQSRTIQNSERTRGIVHLLPIPVIVALHSRKAVHSDSNALQLSQSIDMERREIDEAMISDFQRFDIL